MPWERCAPKPGDIVMVRPGVYFEQYMEGEGGTLTLRLQVSEVGVVVRCRTWPKVHLSARGVVVEAAFSDLTILTEEPS